MFLSIFFKFRFNKLLSNSVFIIILIAFLITISQLLFAYLLSGLKNPLEAYIKLWQADSAWYTHIINNGYQTSISVDKNQQLGNVAFFPGYPLLAAMIKNILGIRTSYALLIAAQLSCWGFWIYVLLFFKRWNIPNWLTIGGVIAIWVYPVSYYLIAGYSESLFLMALLGFLYWVTASPSSTWVLASLHGCIMTATRIVGLPLSIFPVLYYLLSHSLSQTTNFKQYFKNSRISILISILSLSGTLLFFGFCYFKFGQWNLYMKTQDLGWGTATDYLAIFNPEIYRIFIPSRNINGWSRVSVPIIMWLLVIFSLAEWFLTKIVSKTHWEQRFGFYFCGWLIFYTCISRVASIKMISMIRYNLCVYVMLILAIIHLLSSVPSLRVFVRKWCLIPLLFIAGLLVSLQTMFLSRFTHDLWVA